VATDQTGAKERAESSFKKKELQARDASKAMAEYQSEARLAREKTVRLKALREAKEAADAAAALAAKAAGIVPPKEPAAAKKKATDPKKPAPRIAARRSS
jgi:hypothetical protein